MHHVRRPSQQLLDGGPVARISLPVEELLESPRARRHALSASEPEGDIGSWSPEDGSYVAACVAVKDRSDDLREWIDYHRALGVGHFYVFETDTAEASDWALEDLIQEGVVDYYYLPHVTPTTVPMMQIRIYRLCLQHTRHRHAWMAFVDVDEFLVPTNATQGLKGVLEEYADVPGLVVNWRLMGSGGHEGRPAEGTLAAYQSCTPVSFHDNLHVKSIANTRLVANTSTDPHHFEYLGGATAFTTARDPVDGPAAPAVHYEKLALFHYALKSREEYELKMLRGSAMGNYKGMDFFDRVDAAATEQCPQAFEACRRFGLDWCAGKAGA